MATSKQYAVTATANDKVSVDTLAAEIQGSSIAVALDYITAKTTTFTVVFKADISTAEETTLDALVAAHDGVDPVEPTIDRDTTGREVVRTAATQKGFHYQAHSFDFKTSQIGSVYNCDKYGDDLGFVTLKCYKVFNSTTQTECTNQTDADTTCIVTAVKFAPSYDFEVVSANMRQDVKSSTNLRMWTEAEVLTGLSAPYPTTIRIYFANGGLNLKHVGADELLRTDGRASKLIRGSGGEFFEVFIRHDAGQKQEVTFIFDKYKDPAT